MSLTKKVRTLLFITLIFMQSCAVMFQGSKKDVTVKSMTPGASIWINGNKVGEDAVTQRLARKTDHMILVKKEGCETKQIDVRKKTQVGWVIFDALFNWLAFATDAPTGAWNTFQQSDFTVELDCSKPSVKN
jgi:hypothetical protein